MKERRSARRYKLVLPVVICRVPTRSESDLLYGKTRDISTRGLYFTTYQQLAPETKIDLSLYLLTGGSPVLITAQAKVLRVQKERENSVENFGVAALIEKYGISRAKLTAAILNDTALKAFGDRSTGTQTPEGKALVQEAVTKERVRPKRARGPETEPGRKIKRETATPTRLVDRQEATGIIKRFSGQGKSN